MRPSMGVILGSAPEKDDDGDEGSDETTSAAEDVISAVKAGDADALAVALEDFIRACGAGGSEKSDDGDY